MEKFIIGALIGWWVARSPGAQAAVQNIVQGDNRVAYPGGSDAGVLVATPGGVALVGAPSVAPADGFVPWAGCPAGQVAMQDSTGKIFCVAVSQ